MNRSNGRAAIGIIFIIFGALLIADNFTFVDIHLFSWPVIFIIIGAFVLSGSHRSTGGLFLLFFGIFGLLGRIFDFSIGFAIREYWPAALILIGLYMIMKRNHGGTKHSQTNVDSDSDFFDDTGVFSDNKKTITSKNFKGGKITILFGNTTLNLRDTELAEGNQVLDIMIIFGGLTIEARNDFNIIVNATSIFGGFEDKRNKNPNEIPLSGKSLTIKGITLFGGGVIYN